MFHKNGTMDFFNGKKTLSPNSEITLRSANIIYLLEIKLLFVAVFFHFFVML